MKNEMERAEPSRGAPKQTERDYAIWLADAILNRPTGDPDDDYGVLARQFLRAIERETGHVEALRHALPILIGAIAFVDCKAVVAEVRAAIQQAERT